MFLSFTKITVIIRYLNIIYHVTLTINMYFLFVLFIYYV